MAERLETPFGLVESAMPRVFLESYASVINTLIPAEIKDQAGSIVEAHRHEGVLQSEEHHCMAGLKSKHHGDLNIPSAIYPG